MLLIYPRTFDELPLDFCQAGRSIPPEITTIIQRPTRGTDRDGSRTREDSRARVRLRGICMGPVRLSRGIDFFYLRRAYRSPLFAPIRETSPRGYYSGVGIDSTRRPPKLL